MNGRRPRVGRGPGPEVGRPAGVRVSREQIDTAMARGQVRRAAESGNVFALAVVNGAVSHHLFPRGRTALGDGVRDAC